jgi:hypothetical protein
MQYTSWGRTRRPKELNEQLPSSKQTARTVAISAAGDLNASLNDAVAGQNGYATENQEFLHVLVKDTANDGSTVDIYAYNYAFGEWAKLHVIQGADNFVAVSFTATTTVSQYVVPIKGIDRVAFCTAGTNITVRAACSTF